MIVPGPLTADIGREMFASGHKLAVVPAHAGTHNHRFEFVALRWDGFPSDNEYHAVWVPACAGTTDEIAFRDVCMLFRKCDE
jgi:hypothetical protein